MKAVYLGAFRAYHPGFDILYQDINGLRDIGGDMMYVPLNDFDFLIASPPCNFWSRIRMCNYSVYTLATGYLLPSILKKFIQSGKLFVVENVSNIERFKKFGIFDLPCLKYKIGRHMYFTNIYLSNIELKHLRSLQVFEDLTHMPSYNRQGGKNVHIVIDYFLKKVKAGCSIQPGCCFDNQVRFSL